MNVCLMVTALVLAWNAPAPPLVRERSAPAVQEYRALVPLDLQPGALRGEGQNVQAKIIIPRSLLPAGNGAAAGAPKLPALPAPAASRETRSHTPPMGTIIAGIAMSLAAVSFVFILRGSRVKKTAALFVLGGALTVMAVGIAQGDIPGGNRANRPPKPIPEPVTQIVIEVTDIGDTVTLQLAR